MLPQVCADWHAWLQRDVRSAHAGPHRSVSRCVLRAACCVWMHAASAGGKWLARLLLRPARRAGRSIVRRIWHVFAAARVALCRGAAFTV
jgi:hypothetical protein